MTYSWSFSRKMPTAGGSSGRLQRSLENRSPTSKRSYLIPQIEEVTQEPTSGRFQRSLKNRSPGNRSSYLTPQVEDAAGDVESSLTTATRDGFGWGDDGRKKKKKSWKKKGGQEIDGFFDDDSWNLLTNDDLARDVAVPPLLCYWVRWLFFGLFVKWWVVTEERFFLFWPYDGKIKRLSGTAVKRSLFVWNQNRNYKWHLVDCSMQ